MIVRSARPSDRFAIISNAAIEDTRLTFKARGLLAYLLSRPVGWTTSAERLAATASDRDGKDAIKTALRELEQHGYLVRSKGQDGAGKWTWIHEVTDQVEVGKSAPGEAGNPRVVKQEPQDLAAPVEEGVEKSAPPTDGLSVGGFSVDGSSTDGKSADTSKKDYQEGSTKTDPSPPPAPSSYKDAHEGGGMPAPPRLAWYPDDAIIEGAQATYPWLTKVMLREITMSVIAYCKKKGRTPDDSLWLTFVKNENRDREKAEREEAAAKGAEKKSWFAVAGD